MDHVPLVWFKSLDKTIYVALIALSGVIFSAVISFIVAKGQVRENAKYSRLSLELTNLLQSRKLYLDEYQKQNYTLTNEVKKLIEKAIDKREYLFELSEIDAMEKALNLQNAQDATKFREADRIYLQKVRGIRKSLGL
jgi:hypothetical protein